MISNYTKRLPNHNNNHIYQLFTQHYKKYKPLEYLSLPLIYMTYHIDRYISLLLLPLQLIGFKWLLYYWKFKWCIYDRY